MRRNADEQEEMPGGDSFLDIVANIVGILVLLVVVVGVRAGRQVAVVAQVQTVDHEQVIEEAKGAIREALLNRKEVARLVEQAAISLGESQLRNQVREELATYIATLRAELDEERKNLSASDRRTFDTHNQLAQAQLELEKLTRKQIGLIAADTGPEIEQIDFEPTPIVRGRVTDEVLLRLEADRVVYLPVNELKQELEYSMASIRNSFSSMSGEEASFERLVGPIDGFALRCLFSRRLVQTAEGTMVVGGLKVARLEPQAGLYGTGPPTESLNEAMQANSRLLNRLRTVDPKKTVITLITYPDSFDVLPQLEKNLRERGYRVAKSLQRSGKPIAFSPGGKTTVLQ